MPSKRKNVRPASLPNNADPLLQPPLKRDNPVHSPALKNPSISLLQHRQRRPQNSVPDDLETKQLDNSQISPTVFVADRSQLQLHKFSIFVPLADHPTRVG